MQPGSANVISTRLSDADRPVARILPAVIIVNSSKYKSSSCVSSTESFRSLKDESALKSPDRGDEDVRVFSSFPSYNSNISLLKYCLHILDSCFAGLFSRSQPGPIAGTGFLIQDKCRS